MKFLRNVSQPGKVSENFATLPINRVQKIHKDRYSTNDTDTLHDTLHDTLQMILTDKLQMILIDTERMILIKTLRKILTDTTRNVFTLASYIRFNAIWVLLF